MLKKILSISGRPGLFKLVSYGKNIIIVESLLDGKRTAAHPRDRVVALGDISIYTTEDDKPLGEVLEEINKKYNNKPIDKEVMKDGASLLEFIKGVLPTFDEERVHMSDMKKLVSWYNILVTNGYTTFLDKEEEEEEAEKAESKKEKKEEKKD